MTKGLSIVITGDNILLNRFKEQLSNLDISLKPFNKLHLDKVLKEIDFSRRIRGNEVKDTQSILIRVSNEVKDYL